MKIVERHRMFMSWHIAIESREIGADADRTVRLHGPTGFSVASGYEELTFHHFSLEHELIRATDVQQGAIDGWFWRSTTLRWHLRLAFRQQRGLFNRDKKRPVDWLGTRRDDPVEFNDRGRNGATSHAMPKHKRGEQQAGMR